MHGAGSQTGSAEHAEFWYYHAWSEESTFEAPPLVADAWRVLWCSAAQAFYFFDEQTGVTTWLAPPSVEVPGSRFYDLLGVGREADTGAVRKAYRRRALCCHPDKGGDREAFDDLSLAHDVLTDAGQRCLYDRGGEELLEFYRSVREPAELGETVGEDAESCVWRLVGPGEVFGPGREYRLDMETGERYVRVVEGEPGAHAGTSEEEGEEEAEEEEEEGEEEESVSEDGGDGEKEGRAAERDVCKDGGEPEEEGGGWSEEGDGEERGNEEE